MNIEYIIGDLMKAPEEFSIQGCNAQGAMGSGVAKLWRDHDENIFKSYRKVYETEGLLTGQVVTVITPHPAAPEQELILFNAITQEFYGRAPDTRYVTYDGMAVAMADINYQIFSYAGILAGMQRPIGKPRVSLPLIGAGLAQGRWPIIASIIETHATAFKPVVYVQTQADLDAALA